MKRTLPTLITLFLLLSIILATGSALAQSDVTPVPLEDQSDDIDDAAPVTRVARLSFVDGDVSFLRAGVTEWAPAVENLPLLTGDQVFTGPAARAEIQLARGNYIRLSENTELTIADLSNTAAQLEITEGMAIIRIERLATVFQRFEVDTPNSAVLVQQDGLYRVDVRGEENSELIVRRGEAEVSTEEASFKVREGHKLLIDTTSTGKLELAVDGSPDDWDRWSHDRDTTIARTSVDASPDYVASYETDNNDLYGVSDLSSYGTWTNYSSYGQCWIPRVSAGWAPYRSGQWLWIPAAGWTWLSNEPWGWAPYHYGRWSYLSGLGWAWIPGFGSAYRGYGRRDYRWRPALVYFVNCPTPRGNYVGWYPLAPGERWRRHDNRRGNDNARSRDGRRWSDDRRGNRSPQLHHAMTILPAEGFVRGSRRTGARPTAVSNEMSSLISKGARAGLPDLNPSTEAAAPELAENDRRKSRRVAVPANEIIKRPVLTHNAKVDTTPGAAVVRERKLISLRQSEPASSGDASERNAERRARKQAAGSQSTDPADQRPSPKVRMQLPSPSDKQDGGVSSVERRGIRKGNSAGEASGANPEGSNSTAKEEKRRARQESAGANSDDASNTAKEEKRRARQESSDDNNNAAKEERRRARQDESQPPKPRESYPSTDGGTRSREKNHANAEPKPRDDSQQRRKPEESQKSYERVAPAPRVEPKPERPHSESQPKPERQQQKEQRQQQQQPEQRKKAGN
jgi:hypothetical protein